MVDDINWKLEEKTAMRSRKGKEEENTGSRADQKEIKVDKKKVTTVDREVETETISDVRTGRSKEAGIEKTTRVGTNSSEDLEGKV